MLDATHVGMLEKGSEEKNKKKKAPSTLSVCKLVLN